MYRAAANISNKKRGHSSNMYINCVNTCRLLMNQEDPISFLLVYILGTELYMIDNCIVWILL